MERNLNHKKIITSIKEKDTRNFKLMSEFSKEMLKTPVGTGGDSDFKVHMNLKGIESVVPGNSY